MRCEVILFVEDNPDDVKQTLRAFERNNIGNEVVVARDGEEALDYLFGRGAHADRDTDLQPGLILLDLKLPRISGLEVLEHLRADPRTEHVPVVVLTSSTEERDMLRSYSLGANIYVRKPIHFPEILNAARQLGLYWTLLGSGLALLHREPTTPVIALGAEPEPPEGAPLLWPLEVLIATPDADLIQRVRDLLGAQGHRVRHASDARNAFALLMSTLPNVVIVDDALPDIRGAEVVRGLRRSPHGESIAAILLAGDVEAVCRDLADDAVHVLSRAVQLGELAALVREVSSASLWLPDNAEGDPVSPPRID